jgi:tetratricopeptide (TPR) repeat protein
MAEIVEIQGNWARAVELLDEALKIAQLVKDIRLMYSILDSLGEALLELGDYARGQSLFEEALEINRIIGNRKGIAITLCYLGFCANLRGDCSKASSHFHEGLQVIKQIENDHQTAVYLLDIGVFLAKQGRFEIFARLLGVAQRIIPSFIDSYTPLSMTETMQSIAHAQSALGEDAYTAAYEAGKQMSLDEAISYALKELEQ